jgi:hypothetical protein
MDEANQLYNEVAGLEKSLFEYMDLESPEQKDHGDILL